MDSFLDYIAARLKEPSTYVSFGSLATAVGFAVSPENWQLIAAIGMGAGGLLGTILTERKKTTPVEIKAAVQAMVKPEATKSVSTATVEAAMKNGS